MSCKKDNDNEEISVICSNGYVSMGGSCLCPEPMIEANGYCIELQATEYIGYLSDCFVNDTILLDIGVPDEEGIVNIGINERIRRLPPSGITTTSMNLRYVETITGDSLAPYMSGFGNIFYIAEGPGINYLGDVQGKFTADRDSLNIIIEWRDRFTQEFLDTCSFTLHQ